MVPLVVFAGDQVREILGTVIFEIPGLFLCVQQELLVDFVGLIIQLIE